MTDFQFEYVMKLKDKVTELTNELSTSLGASVEPAASDENRESNGMTDYQFKQFETMRDKLDALSRETNFLRMENAMLKSELKKLKKT